LQRDDRQDGRQIRRGLRYPDDVVRGVGHPAVAGRGQRDDAAPARPHLLDVGEHLVPYLIARADGDHGHVLVDQGNGSVLHLPCRIALRVDVGDLLQLQRALEGDGVVDAATEEQKVLRVHVLAGQPFIVVPIGQYPSGQVGQHREIVQKFAPPLPRERSPRLAQVHGQQVGCHHLRRERLGGGHADFRAGVQVDDPVRQTGCLRADDIHEGDRLHSFVARGFHGSERVHRFTGLRDNQYDAPRFEQRISIAELGTVIYLHGKSGEILDKELGQQAGVPGRTAAHGMQATQVGKHRPQALQIRQDHLAAVEIDAAADHIRDRPGLLVDLLEHEVLVAVPGHGHRVPLHWCDLLLDEASGEIHDGGPVPTHHGNLPVVQEDHSLGVVQDRWHVRSDEHFPVAHAEDDAAGVAEAGSHQAVGFIRAHGHDSARATQLRQGLPYGRGQVAGPLLVAAGHQMGDDLRVGL